MDYEVEVIPGLEEPAERELRAKLDDGLAVLGRPREGRIAIRYRGEPRRVNLLRSAIAVYRVERFDARRPTALLGHENFDRVVRLLRGVIAMNPPGRYTTLRLSAAGAESPTFVRLKEQLARETGLSSASDAGNASIVVRRSPTGAPGWEVLVRTSPRPLSARSWRVCDLPGALNASVAYVMDELAGPAPEKRFLNVLCGSGTLLVERLGICPAQRVIGVDRSELALACARENALASGHAPQITLLHADATCLPLGRASVDTVVADLPYGLLVGSHRENAELYPAVVQEAARVAVPGASFVAITARRRLFEAALDRSRADWRCTRVLSLKIPFRSGYLTPAIYVLRRQGGGTIVP